MTLLHAAHGLPHLHTEELAMLVFAVVALAVSLVLKAVRS